MDTEHHILRSWQRNAEAWSDAVRQGHIESRTLVTNQAVVDAVMAHRPRSVLDLGCGEGWLARALAAQGARVTGVDAVAALVERAQAAGGATYRVSSYQDILDGSLTDQAPFDAVVSNFSLFGQQSVEQIISYVPRLLPPGGRFIVQTLHPLVANGDQPYQDGWRDGSWQGFGPQFSDPAPWYFRTLASWVRLLTDRGLTIEAIEEPVHPHTQQPASVIFVSTLSP